MRGKSFTHPALVTYVMRNRAGICRFGITTSKKIGNAVERNRAKRVIRAAFFALSEEVLGNWDIVFVARGRTKWIKSTELEKVMKKQLCAAGVIYEKSVSFHDSFLSKKNFAFVSATLPFLSYLLPVCRGGN